MKRLVIFLVITAGLAMSSARSFAQAYVTEFTCIGASTAASCSDGTASLRSYGTAGTKYVSVSGYRTAGDGGTGEFYNLGSVSGTPVCASPTTLQGTSVVGTTSITITFGSLTGLTVGELVNASGTGIQTQLGTEIASIVTTGTPTIIVTLPLIGTTGTTLTSIAFGGNNGGTLIIDAAGDCFQKSNYRGDPHEWGAYGDYDVNDDTGDDDTGALENWLGAYGNAVNIPTGTAPPNFGPWNASIPANYMVTMPLTCPPGAQIAGPAVQAQNEQPPVRIIAARQKNQSGSTFAGNAPNAVLIMGAVCRLTGVAVDGNGVKVSGTTHGSMILSALVDNLTDITHVQIGDLVTAADIPAGTTVVGIDSLGTACSTTMPHCVTLSVAIGSSHSEQISFNGPNSVDIEGQRDTIDGHSLIENGYNNVYCNNQSQFGLQLKDSQFIASGSDDISLAAMHTTGCPNVRVIGNVIYFAGGSGVVFDGADINISNNVIDHSVGIGLDLTGATKVSVGGNLIDDSGRGANGGAGIEIDNTAVATICNNVITGNGEYSATPAQIHFAGVDDEIDLCANVYRTDQKPTDATVIPSYVYDADAGTVLTNSRLYETPPPQVLGAIYSPSAAPILSQLQVPQVVPSQISGFTLSNSSPTTAVQMTAGIAADSSSSVLIQNSSTCTVDLALTHGQGALDEGTVAPTSTYFYFALA